MTIGVANLPNQKHRRAAKRGAHFTLMTVGASGLGKSTFINTLFATSTPLMLPRDHMKRYSKDESKIRLTEADLEERGFHLKLTVIDTPGFGDSVNNSNCHQPIIDHIEAQYMAYLNQDMRADRSYADDTRVHAVMYFIEPSGHQLSALDVKTMKEIGQRANLIPVIAKADTLTPEDISAFKARIRKDISRYGIRVYQCPVDSDDEESTKRNKEIMDAMPFAIIGSEEILTVNGQQIRGRKYPWGIAEVENDSHCDFKKLRSLLLRTHLLDLIMTTQEDHYERFRDEKLIQGGLSDGMTPEQLKKDIEVKMKKYEENMRQRFTEQVKAEEKRFRVMEETLQQQEVAYKKELDDLQKEVDALKENVRKLEAAKQAATPKKK